MAPSWAAQRQLTRHDVTSATACSMQGTEDFPSSGLAHSSKDPPMAAEPGAIAAEYAASAGLRLAAAGKLGAGVPQQP
jgi:hypothetical protein